MTRVIYPLSADPIHNGHISNIERLSNLGTFSEICIALGKNYEKKIKYLFSDQEKLWLTKKALAKFNNRKKVKISVEIFNGLLAHFSKKKNTNLIIRGARNDSDFEAEQTLAEFNRAYDLQTLIMPAPKDTFSISSTTIKAIVANGGLVSEFVPPVIKQALEEKLLGLTLIGVTGNIGSGKTSLCKKLCRIDKNFSHIEVDNLIKELYKSNSTVKQMIKTEFGNNIYSGNAINRQKLASIIFNNYQKRLKLVEILRIPFKISLEEKIAKLKGFVLLDCAYLVEYDLMPLINYNILLLTCSNKTKYLRNKKAQNVINAQFTDSQLLQEIKKQQSIYAVNNLLAINTDKKIDYRKIAQKIKSWKLPISFVK